MPPSLIVILGAGIGGLTLGRCLRQKGIASVVYDRAPSAPRHTYAITLEPRAYKPLLNVLDIDERSFRKEVAVDSLKKDGGGRVSAKDGDSSNHFRANRSKLEVLLREGQTIHFEHKLTSATTMNDNGSSELEFENGLKLRPRLVVDALGVHSPLRQSLIPDVTPEVQPFAVYSGKRYVQDDQFQSTYANAFGNGNVLVREPSHNREPRLEISVNDHLSDGRVSISYIYSRAARNDSSGKDPLHNPDRPQAGATDIPKEFYNELSDFVKGHEIDRPFSECFDANLIRNERLLHWLMRTVMVSKEDLMRLLEYGVIMIGDAAHAVPILGGHGANIAILDAIRLADALAERDRNPNALTDFYLNQWPGWNDAVEDSKKQLVEMHRGSSAQSSNL